MNESLNKQADSYTEQVVQHNPYRAEEDPIAEAIILFQKKELLSAGIETRLLVWKKKRSPVRGMTGY